MPLKERLYLSNKSYIYIIGCPENGFKIKLVTMKIVRNGDVVCDSLNNEHFDFKLSESICRSRHKIYDLAMCNPWDYFFTGTLYPDK